MPRRRTTLEQLIERRVQAATVLTVSSATERLGEEMARELIKTPEFRRTLRVLAHEAFQRTVSALSTTTNSRKRGPKSKRPTQSSRTGTRRTTQNPRNSQSILSKKTQRVLRVLR